ncbi:MAG: DUF1501 domain-containing protein [Planctomycetota bacterium]|jgi:hypothetical protein|nr:DUF1501 domain-containing protein [Planctomycetota bacterium]
MQHCQIQVAKHCLLRPHQPSLLALVLALGLAGGNSPILCQDEDKDEPFRIRVNRVIEIRKDGRHKKALQQYEKWVKTDSGRLPDGSFKTWSAGEQKGFLDFMREMYDSAGEDAVATRREFLCRAGAGFGALAFTALSGQSLFAARQQNPAAAKIPHRVGQAMNIIWLFMEGGPSHIDLFDPKPLLNGLAGQKLPDRFPRPVTAMGEVNSPLLECKRKWAQCGESGLWISDWLPHHRAIADELCVIRSCVSDGINHAEALQRRKAELTHFTVLS